MQLKELNTKLDDTARNIEDTKEQGLVADKRVGLMTTEIEELRSALEQGIFILLFFPSYQIQSWNLTLLN